MYRRQHILLKVLEAFAKGIKYLLVPVKDPDKDQKLLAKMFSRRGEDVGIYKDPFGEGLWFKKK